MISPDALKRATAAAGVAFALAALILTRPGIAVASQQQANVETGGTASACPDEGSLLGSYENVEAYSNGGNTCCTTWQCTEYVKRFYRDALKVDVSNWHGLDAWEMFGHASDRNLDAFANGGTTAPQAEDILCYDNNTDLGNCCGHVAIIRGINPGSIDIIEQNWSCSSCYRNITMSVSNGTYTLSCSTKYPIQGWMRRKNPCSPANNIYWTSAPTAGRWYRSNERLSYHVDGSGTVNGRETTSDGCHDATYQTHDGYLDLNYACLGWNEYRSHASNDCGSSDVTWTGGRDDEAPTASRSGGAAPNTWYRNAQTVSWSASDGSNRSGVKTQWYRWNGGSWVQSAGPVSLPEGKNTLEVQVEDNAWNGGTQSGNVGVYNLGQYWLDTTGPTTSLTGPATSTWLNTPQAVTWSATDATSGILDKKLTWDNGAETNASPAPIPQGKRTATVTATDNAGNTATQTYGTWWVDTVPPVPAVILSPSSPNGDNGWYVSDPVMTVVANDPNGADGSGVDQRFYTLDGAPEVVFTAPVTISGDGIHVCAARATDIAGNSGATADMIVRVDTTAPVFDSIYTDSESRSLDTLVATWSCSDPDSGIAEYQYWIGTQPGLDDIKPVSSAGANNWAYVVNLNLVPGQSCYFTVRARSVAGLWSPPVTSSAILANQGQRDAGPSLNMGGVSVTARASMNYQIVDSIGQFVVAASDSPNFTIEHGYWHSEFSPPYAESIGAAKWFGNGQTLQIGASGFPLVVTSGTSTFADRFYVEQPNRSSGIAVQYGAAGGPALVEGDQVTLVGKIDTVNGERTVRFGSPTIVGHTNPLGPLAIMPLFLGGETLNEWTPGVLDGIGLNNVGLLVRTVGGLVSYRDYPQGRFFYVDNGDNLWDGYRYGVRIICDNFVGGARLAMPAYGTTCVVTGISSVVTINGQPVRALRPRRQSDIQEW